MFLVCRLRRALQNICKNFLDFRGGFADFCGQVERELWDLSGFVAERVRTPVKERGLGAGFLLRRKTPPHTLSQATASAHRPESAATRNLLLCAA
jgi:hypothetical protein